MRTKKSPPLQAQSPNSDDLVRAKLLPFVVALDAGRRVREPSEPSVLPFITKETYLLRRFTLGWCAYRQRLRDAELRQEAERLVRRADDNPNGPSEGNQ